MSGGIYLIQDNCQLVEMKEEPYESEDGLQKLLIDLIGNEEADLEKFWQQVKVNLQLGKVRLVFVADKIPTELQRIVEFLNQQMNPAQVLAVEIKQHVGQGLKTLVPSVIGQKKKPLTPPLEKRQWDALSFMKEVEIKYSPEAAKVASLIIEWATLQTLSLDYFDKAEKIARQSS